MGKYYKLGVRVWGEQGEFGREGEFPRKREEVETSELPFQNETMPEVSPKSNNGKNVQN